MIGLGWWEPGSPQGLLSRRWTQVFLFPVPKLRDAEIHAALRFKAKAILPTQDVALRTRAVTLKGKRYGLVIVDRLPADNPGKGLYVGVPLLCAKTWEPHCVLAVASPDGWEFHSYENEVLVESYPPSRTGSLVDKILAKHPARAVYWISPDDKIPVIPPAWAQPAPAWPRSLLTSIPWNEVPPSPWPWVAAATLAAAALVFWTLVGVRTLQDQAATIAQWEAWVHTARGFVPVPTGSVKVPAQPLENTLYHLARAWPSHVVVLRFEIKDQSLSLTARAPSALAAVAALSDIDLGYKIRVVEIRPVPGGEEFDLEGARTP